MTSHVFVTTKHLDRCTETGLFGVTVSQVNYLANCHKGDSVFLLETQSGRLAGPFTITQPLFFNNTPVWETQGDPFVYRVKFTSNEAWEHDVVALWKVLLHRDVSDFYVFTTFQRSNNTLMRGEEERLISTLKEGGRRIPPTPLSTIEVSKANLIGNDTGHFSSEARLEAALLINQEFLQNVFINEQLIHEGLKPLVMNQLTLPGTNYNVDIAMFIDKHVIVIELKKGKIDPQAIAQLRRYRNFWHISGRQVTLVAIGEQVAQEYADIVQFTYSLDRDKGALILRRDNREYVNLL